jgi:hypothetical protein
MYVQVDTNMYFVKYTVFNLVVVNILSSSSVYLLELKSK